MSDLSSHTSTSTIVAAAQDETVWMGADSAVVAGDHVFRSKASSVVKRADETQELLIGITGQIQALNVVRHHLQLPDRKDRDGPEYIYRFAEALRTVFDGSNLIHTRNQTGEWSGRALVGLEGSLYQIGPRLSMTPMADDFTAIGPGRKYAVGGVRGLDPGESAVRKALEVAAKHDPSSQKPFTIKRIPG